MHAAGESKALRAYNIMAMPLLRLSHHHFNKPDDEYKRNIIAKGLWADPSTSLSNQCPTTQPTSKAPWAKVTMP